MFESQLVVTTSWRLTWGAAYMTTGEQDMCLSPPCVARRNHYSLLTPNPRIV
jgi:hypothetical protein